LFVGVLYLLALKLRKSPFDISSSRHAHQEIVNGIMTEFTGSTLGRIEIAEWYETILMLGFIYLFFGFNPLIALVAVGLIYLFQIFVDNNFPRLKWPFMLKSAWFVAVLGLVNIAVLWYRLKGGV